jgi:hypothetical protein
MERPELAHRGTCALLLTVLVAMSGCGGGSSAATGSAGGASSSGSPVSNRSPAEARLIARADAICNHLNIQLTAYEAIRPKETGTVEQEIVRRVPINEALERRALRELAKLAPPPSLAHDWDTMQGYRQALISQLRAFVREARRHDTQAVKAVYAAKKNFHGKLTTVATRDGFKDCSHLG